MAEICIVCNEEITEDEDVAWNNPYDKSDGVMHKTCGELNNESLKKQREIDQHTGKRKQELKKKSKGMILTDIDLPFGRVLWVTVQFFVAGLIIAIPIWIIFIVVIYNQ